MIKSGGISDIGVIRQNNEDSIFVSDESVGILPNLYIVADGMGGHSAGEIASSKAIEFFIESLAERNADDEPLSAMISAVAAANAGVYLLANERPETSGMGTTFSAVSISEDPDGFSLICVHVGDSRIYVISSGDIGALTADHSYVADLVRRGDITPEEARIHPRRNLITRALGTDSEVEIDRCEARLKTGDIILICSDGLSSCVSDEDILAAVTDEARTPKERADLCAAMANAGGGRDNISAIVIDLL